MARGVVLTDKQTELLNRAKKILGIVNDMDQADKNALFAIVYQFLEVEDRKQKGEAYQMAEEKLRAEQANLQGALNLAPAKIQ